MRVVDTIPFSDALRAVFSTMIRLDFELGEPFCSSVHPPHDATATVQLSGDVTGSITLSMPVSVASTLISKFTGCEFPSASPEFSDALGEIANMISGAAKSRFKDRSISLSIPTVSVGRLVQAHATEPSARLTLPCKLRTGGFYVQIDLQDNPTLARKIA